MTLTYLDAGLVLLFDLVHKSQSQVDLICSVKPWFQVQKLLECLDGPATHKHNHSELLITPFILLRNRVTPISNLTGVYGVAQFLGGGTYILTSPLLQRCYSKTIVILIGRISWI